VEVVRIGEWDGSSSIYSEPECKRGTAAKRK
jgi:hypothetical protein